MNTILKQKQAKLNAIKEHMMVCRDKTSPHYRALELMKIEAEKDVEDCRR